MLERRYLARIASMEAVAGELSTKIAFPAFGITIAKRVLRTHGPGAEKTAERDNQFRDQALRVPSVFAFNVGGTPPRPRTTPTGLGATKARTTKKAHPPSNLPYFRDVMKSLYNPGARPLRMGQTG